MTRLSSYFLPTLKDPPADAEAISHVLMVRAGLVRQLGAGLWTYLPAGWRVHRRIEQILREEMNRIGALEVSMPVMHPRDLWDRTGRSEIPELFRLEDRNALQPVGHGVYQDLRNQTPQPAAADSLQQGFLERSNVDSLSEPDGPVPTYLDLLRVTTETVAAALTP